MARIRNYCNCGDKLVVDQVDKEMKRALLDEWDRQHADHEALSYFEYIWRFWGGEPRE